MCPYIQIILPSYGVLAFVGGFAALLFTYLRLDRFQIAFTQLLKIVVVCIIGCVLGSKLMYALTQIPWLVENFSLENLVLFIPSSGYVFYGGLLGVILAISLYTRKDRDLRTRIYHMSHRHSHYSTDLDGSAALWLGAVMVYRFLPR